eukprot:SAG11_NODE_1224_length_5481_cov_3.755853_1_plen_658_part_00
MEVAKAGGSETVQLVVSVLEHAADLLEGVSSSTPRKGRKAVREVLERVEAMAETVDSEWAKDVSRCGGADLEKLASMLRSVRELATGECGGAAVVERVSELLECLVRCGSAVLQSVAVLEAEESERDDRVLALEVLRGLGDGLQEVASSEEVSAVSVVLLHMGVEHGQSVRVSAGLALFCLASRNGFAVCESVELIQSVSNHLVDALKEVGSAGGGKDTWDVCAAMAASVLILIELSKIPSARRGPFERQCLLGIKATIGQFKSFAGRSELMLDGFMSRGLLQHADASLASGAAYIILWPLYSGVFEARQAAAVEVFDAAWSLYQRVRATDMKSLLVRTSSVIDAACARMIGTSLCLVNLRSLSTPELKAMSWWPALVQETIEIVKLNHSEQLTEKDTACFLMVQKMSLLELAAKDEAHHGVLLEAGVLSALEYTCANDFVFLAASMSAYAAGTAVLLIGKNESGGKTLSRETVSIVLRDVKLELSLRDSHFRSQKAFSAMVTKVARVSTMAVSDANKAHMLAFDGLLGVLVAGLLLESPRRGEKDADTLQEACVGVLLQLALFAPWADVMRADAAAMDALGAVQADTAFATDTARQSAEQALFQLSRDRQDAASAASPAPGEGRSTKHVMVSYCWAQQPLVKRMGVGTRCGSTWSR